MNEQCVWFKYTEQHIGDVWHDLFQLMIDPFILNSRNRDRYLWLENNKLEHVQWIGFVSELEMRLEK